MIQPIADTGPLKVHAWDSGISTPPDTQNSRSKTVLIVEDEQDVIDLLAIRLLKGTNYTISTANDGVTGLEKARAELPWIIILDLMLPKMSGLEVCRVLKSDRVTKGIPIIILSAKANEADRLAGLELGADDYVTKPFSPREVLLRIRASERLRSAETDDERLVCGLISLDRIRHQVEVGGKPVRLTSAEFKLLSLLMKKPGRVHSRDILLTGAWGYETLINTRTVDTHIGRLRNKLGKAANAIETVRGFGYRLLGDS